MHVRVLLDTHPLRPPAQDAQVPEDHAQQRDVRPGLYVWVDLLNPLRVPVQLDTHPGRPPAQDVRIPLQRA